MNRGGEGMAYFTAEYSARQDCFHVDTLSRVLSMNRKNALEKRSVDYQIIAITESDDEALKACRDFREKQSQLIRSKRYDEPGVDENREEVM